MQRIQEGSTGRLLAERFKLAGSVQPSMDETVQPVISVGSLDVGGLPAIRRVAMGFANKIGGVAQHPAVRFEVPAGILALITRVRLHTDTAASMVNVHFGNALAGPFTAAGNPPQFADGRVRGSPAGAEAPACRLFSAEQPAVIAATNLLAAPLAPDQRTYDVDWPVGGRNVTDAVEFLLQATQEELGVNLEWIEYIPF